MKDLEAINEIAVALCEHSEQEYPDRVTMLFTLAPLVDRISAIVEQTGRPVFNE